MDASVSPLGEHPFVASDLAGVEIKLRRAEVHLAAIRAAMTAFIEVELHNNYTVAMEDDPTHPRRKLLVWKDLPALDPSIGAVLGDFAHNARSALDQLLWVLVRLNGGTPDRHTQWPIYRKRTEWRRNITARAPDRGPAPTQGVSDAAFRLIEGFQPFKLPSDQRKGSPLAHLADVNNIDKHRTLHAAFPFPSQLESGPTFKPTGFLEAVKAQKAAQPIPAQDGAVILRFELRELQPVPPWLEITMNPPPIGIHVAFYADDQFIAGVDHLDPMLAEARRAYEEALDLPEVKTSSKPS